MTTDLLTNAERGPSERPPRLAPLLPDVSPHPEPRWCGSVNGLISHWRERALKAERVVAQLRHALERYRQHP
jgi:hypothetical protein